MSGSLPPEKDRQAGASSQPQPRHAEITDFDLLNALGSGSYSTVFRARHRRSRDTFAMKTVAKAGLSRSSTDALLQEIKLLKTLRHKYIVEMLDFMWDDKNIYILMELCAGGDLSAYIRRHRRLPESTCKFFLRQLAIAMRYMRTHNVSHFDLKPHNLLLTTTPALTLKVADFGFAQHLDLAATNTQLKGSPLYMAPEILLRRGYDASADLWSIGCILYECVFGAAPYRSQTLEELLQKVRRQAPIEVPAGRLSPACEDLLGRLLRAQPAARITFDEFFAHEFVDVEHEPTAENLARAVQLITQAVALDRRGAGEAERAYAAYCDGLRFFVPLIAAERNAAKREQLRRNADAYLRRAEEIREAMGGCGAAGAQQEKHEKQEKQPSSTGPTTRRNAVQEALQPARQFSDLRAACESSAALRDGLDIGRQAELYQCERDYGAAIREFRSALGLLVPAVAAELRGPRRDALLQLVSRWMTEAERLKVLLETREQLAAAAEDESNGVVEAADEATAADADDDDGATRGSSTLAYAKNCCVQ